MLGCTPPGRHTEQHDVFFGIGSGINDLKQEIIDFWPEAGGKIHMDAWREVTLVDGYAVGVCQSAGDSHEEPHRLFFLNLGGYRENEFDELHYKMLVVAGNKAEAIQRAKQTAFYRHTGFSGASSHIDDKYGVDVDDIFEIAEILAPDLKNKYRLRLRKTEKQLNDQIHLGYMKIENL